MMRPEPRYLGDGVYGHFDGYQVWLSVGSHEAPPVVALEGKVIEALIKYHHDCTNPQGPDA